MPPLYRGSVRLLDWKNTARSGMTVDLGLREAGPLGVHPFKGLGTGKEHGQRFRILVCPPVEGDEPLGAAEAPIYVGEAILMRWSDDCLNGMLVRFLLDGGPDGAAGAHPFEGMIAGRKEGEPLFLSAWAIGDDERAQHPGHVRRRTPFHELSEVKQSQILCRDMRFVSFLASNEVRLLGMPVAVRPEEDSVRFAAEVVRSYLGIETRAVLGHDTAEANAARRRWKALLNEYFASEWSRTR